MIYYRPVAMTDPARPAEALPLAGGWCWFDRVEVLTRAGSCGLIPARDLPEAARLRLSDPRPALCGLAMDRVQIMGILNVTPDSFSDGGDFQTPATAEARAQEICRQGAALLDIGGESTRPGAAEVPLTEEIARTAPVIAALRAAGLRVPI
ncbi:dihydropteroate synthase, partial [Thioclava sp. BHET1]